MTLFGLDHAEVTSLISAVTPEAAGDEMTESFARASWSGIAEPGDRVAGALLASIGAARSLELLVDQVEQSRIQQEAAASGAQLSNDDVSKALARWRPRLSSGITLTSLRQAGRLGVRLLTPESEHWPAGMDDLGDHGPAALWLRGRTEVVVALARSISLVGARAATGYGEHVTMEVAAGLCDRGVAIVSGAAYGIDGMAHRSALASGGQTVAFLAGGVDRFYPSGHDALLTRIAAEGAVFSELPCGAQPSKWRFLQRNRLIAAASGATVVLEAGWRSGSLNTAGHASTLGRPLGAVPGPVTSAASAGCHRLIRDFDAVCVTTAEEMAELLPDGSGTVGARQTGEPELTAEATRVLDALSARTVRSVEELARRSGLSPMDVRATLGALELDGEATESQGGWRGRRR